MTDFDVTIYGAGVFGLSVGFACLKRGAKVQVIDPKGVAAGASGGVVGALAPHTPDLWNVKKQFQFESLIQSRSFWPEVEATSGLVTGYVHQGRLQPVINDHQLNLACDRIDGAVELWQGLADWNVTQSPHVPSEWVPHSATGWWVYDTLSAHIQPRLATVALAKAVQVLGGVIRAEGQPTGKVVHCTGWTGLVQASAALGKLLGNGVKGQAAVLDIDGQGLPQVFTDGVHILPHSNGTVAIGSTSERYFDNPTATDTQLDDLIIKAKTLLPILEDAAVLETWAGVRPRAKNRSPILGQHPIYPNQFIANGGFKIGFAMAPKVGEVMADLVLDGVDKIPEDFKPAASLNS